MVTNLFLAVRKKCKVVIKIKYKKVLMLHSCVLTKAFQ